MTKFFIAGGCGFMGSEFVRQLTDRGDEVIVADIHPERATYSILGDLPVVTTNADIRDPAIKLFVGSCDYVIHLAGITGTDRQLADHRGTLDTILEGAANIIDSCTDLGVPLLYMSSPEVYGKRFSMERVELHEQERMHFGPPHKKSWVAGLSYGLAEQMVHEAMDTKGLYAIIVRPFGAVGPGQSPEGGQAFPSFVQATLSGENLVVHGDGSQTRTFRHVSEIVAGCLALLATKEAWGETVNLGSALPCTIHELAETFLEVAKEYDLSPTSDISYQPTLFRYGPDYEGQHYLVPNLDKAQELIGWTPESSYSLKQLVVEALANAASLEAERVKQAFAVLGEHMQDVFSDAAEAVAPMAQAAGDFAASIREQLEEATGSTFTQDAEAGEGEMLLTLPEEME